MKNVATLILLTIGCFWTLFTVWMLIAIAGVAGPVISPLNAIFYWSGLFIGPVMLVGGAGLLLSRSAAKIAAALVSAGCVILSGMTVFNLIGALHRQPLQAPPPYAFLTVMFAVCVVADCAGYAVLRNTKTRPFLRVGDKSRYH